jgi:small multidrug resistance pump
VNVWVLLSLAIAVEVTATLSLRASDGFSRLWPSIVVVVGYGIAFWLLSLVLRTMPVGTVYAIWSAVGVAAVAVLGKVLYDDPLPLMGVFGILLIIGGIVILRASGAGE